MDKLGRAIKASEEIEACLLANGADSVLQQGLLSQQLYRCKCNETLNTASFQDVFQGYLKDTRHIGALSEELWEQLKEVGKKYSAEELSLAADRITRKIHLLGTRTESGPLTPEPLYPIIATLLDIQPGDRVADIGCGLGDVMLYLSDVQPEASYLGYEIDQETAALAESRTVMSNRKIQVIIQDAYSLSEESKFDKIFMHIPPNIYMQKRGDPIRKISDRAEYVLNLFKEKCSQSYIGFTAEWALIDMLCSRLKKNGKVVALLPSGWFLNGIHREAREYFFENGLFERLIYLPNRLPKMAQPSVLAVFSHGNQQAHIINAASVLKCAPHSQIIDRERIEEVINAIHAESEIGKWVRLEDLIGRDYVPRMGFYRTVKKNKVPLSAVKRSITRGVRYSLDELRAMESKTPTPIRYLTVSNIHDGIIDTNLPYLKASAMTPKLQRFLVKPNSLLLCKNAPIKAAVASIPEGEQLVLGNNIYAIEVDEQEIDPFYLLAFFESTQGKVALEDIAAGTSIKVIGIDRLTDMYIPVPPLKEQQRIADECRIILRKISEAQTALESATSQLRQVIDICGHDCT